MIAKDKSVALYQSIADENEDRVYEYWHASSLAICPRAHYFKRLGVPMSAPQPTAAKMLRWQAGHIMETAIRQHIVKVWGGGKDVMSNKRFTSEKLQLTGEFDNLAVANNTLVEIKTVHDYALIERDGEATLKKDSGQKTKWGKPAYEPLLTPYLHHEIQNHGYAHLLEENGVTVENIDYVYITLSGRIVVYHTEVSNNLKERVLKRIELLNEAWVKKQPPDCKCDPKSELWGGVYQWCDYQQEGKPCCDLRLLKN